VAALPVSHLKLLIVIEDFQVGGAQIFAVRLANALADHHDVHVYNNRPTIYDARLRKLIGKKVHIVGSIHPVLLYLFWIIEKPFRPFSRVRKKFATLLSQFQMNRLSEIVSSQGITVVNSHMFFGDVFARELKKRSPSLNFVISMHGCYENKFANLGALMLEHAKENLEHADAVVVAAEKNKFIFNKFTLSHLPRLTKIYYGYQGESRGVGVESATFNFGIVSRAIPDKGWEEAIQAFLKIEQEHPDARLVLVGASPWQASLRSRYHHPKISFAGHAENPEALVRSFSVGLLPTYFKGESLPNSVIEYLAAGKPVIATNMGEIEKMMDADGQRAGILLELRNGRPDVDELAEAMRMLIMNVDETSRLAALAPVAFKKFSMDVCCHQYLQIFSRS